MYHTVDEHVIHEVVRLRRRQLQLCPFFLDTDEHRAKLEQRVRAQLSQSHRWRVWEGPAGLRAVAMARRDLEAWYGAPTTFGILDLDPSDLEIAHEAASWLAGGDEPDLEVAVPAPLAAAGRALSQAGLRLDAIELFGDPRVGGGPPLPEGVDIRPAETDDLERVLAIREAAFQGAPCWFALLPGWRDRAAREFLDLRGPRALLHIDGRTVGYVAAGVADTLAWGRIAGMDLAFTLEARGRGLLRPAMGWLHRALLDIGVVRYRGVTAQPAVLRVAGEGGRVPWQVYLRRHSTVDPALFAGWLTPSWFAQASEPGSGLPRLG